MARQKRTKRNPNQVAAFVRGYMRAHPPEPGQAKQRFREAIAAYRQTKRQNPIVLPALAELVTPAATGVAQGIGAGAGIALVGAVTRRNPGNPRSNPRFQAGEMVQIKSVNGMIKSVERTKGGLFGLGARTLYRVDLPNGESLLVGERQLRRTNPPPQRRRRRQNPNLGHCVECGSFHNPAESGRKRCPRCLRNYRRRVRR